MKKLLLLIDANSLIHRMYYAMPNLTDSHNNPAGAIYGLASVLIKIKNEIYPDYAVALFDRPEPTFRKEEYDKYKANRPKSSEELISQIISAHGVFDVFSIKTIEKPGFEADDLIGTLAQKFKKDKSIKIIIFTGDLDALQLVDDGKVLVETFKRGISETIRYNSKMVENKLGVLPDKVIDYKAMVGDKSDNIPGVFGIGPKAAVHILSKFKSLEDYIKNGKGDKYYEKIIEQKNNAILSKKLVTIVKNVPVEVNLDDIKFSPDNAVLVNFFEKKGFRSLIKRIIFDDLKNENDKTTKEKTKKSIKSTRNKKYNDAIFIDKYIDLSVLNSKLIKVGYDLKSFYKKHNFITPFVDIEIGFQLLGEKFKDWEELSTLLFHKVLSYKDFLRKSYEILIKRIYDEGVEKIFWDIEMPLIPILSEMEMRGVLVDKKELKKIKKELDLVVNKMRKNILEKIGFEININSPQQLLEYFNSIGAKLKSTSADRFKKIQNKFPIVKDILEYRTTFKLKTTYVDAYEKIIADDKRIHPTFLQLGAATGRLSCQSPNLQNVSQESKWATKIRNIFVAPKNYKLVSFDYSQIELRILASVSGDKNMIYAFKHGKDIHRITAHKIFGISEDNVQYHQRRIAKTLNFGIIFGMGARAFAKESGLSIAEAAQFINKYFKNFPNIKKWQARVLKYARMYGKSVNINGRFRKLPLINSPNQRDFAGAERMAINMPLQSVAADIIKIAMNKIDSNLKKEELKDKVKMILTIHDELIFEINNKLISNGKESKIIEDISNWMDNVYKLNVPLKVEVKIGKKWGLIK